MKRLFIFVLLGLAFAAPGEVLNQILARQNVRAFGSTMTSYTVLLAPCLIMGPGFAELKKSFARFFASFSLLYLIVAVVVPKDKGGIFFAFIIFAGGTTGLNYYYVKYIKELAKCVRP